MSVVWRASDEILRRPVAVKVLRSDPASGPAAGAIVLAEAQSAARVVHPNVASVFDYGDWVSPDGTMVPYLVMELLAGPTLGQRLDAGPLETPVALRIASEIAAGLAAAHDVGLVHRDIKPGNIILSTTGAKIVDFGIAAVAGEPDGVDASGHMIGTLAYLSPERLRPGVAVPATDIYAWGVLLSHMLTGRAPWPADATLAQRTDHVRQADPLPSVPPEVDSVFRRCLEPDPDRRPTAREVAAVVGAAAGIFVAPDVLPQDRLPRATADEATAHLTRRLPQHARPDFFAGRAADTATYPVPWPTRSHRVRTIASIAVPTAIAAVVLAVVVLRNGPTGAGPESAEPGTSAGAVPSTAPAQPNTPASAKAAPVDVRLTSAGGSVVASCDDGVVLVHNASPASGFEIHDGIHGPGTQVEIRFRNDSADVRMIIHCVSGAPTYTLKN